MKNNKISFISGLVVAVSICSMCLSVPAYAKTSTPRPPRIGVTITDEMTDKDENGKMKGSGARESGNFDDHAALKDIIVGHLYTSGEDMYRERAAKEGYDFDRLYKGYEGIQADLDAQYDSVYFLKSRMPVKFGWSSEKITNYKGTTTYWGYCDDLNKDYAHSEWKLIGNKWYYFNAHGAAIFSTTQWIEGKQYTFNADCSLAS